MATEVILPRQGQSVESCLILKWRKQPGETVEKGEVICEVESDKATFEVEATKGGTLLKVLFEEGDDVPVLSPIAYIGEPGEKIEAPPQASSHSESSSTKIRISPRARNLARTKGVQIEELAGSGPGGRILERDVRAVLDTQEPMTSTTIEHLISANISTTDGASAQRVETAAGTAEPPTVKPVRGIRKLIAERMHASLRDTAQLTISAGADARALLQYRRRLKESLPEKGLSAITLNDLVLFAVSRVLVRHPEMNAVMADDAITEYHEVHIGFAVDTPRGLMVPVLRNAHLLSLIQLSGETKRLSQACFSGDIDPDELTDGTFTVSNLGSFGVESFTPVLNAPQVGILGVCAIVPKPVMGEQVEFVPTMGLSLTVDHRAVDGAPAARFLQDVSAAIRDIDLTMAQ